MSVTVWQAALLGLVQGLTEFLPISSTAHLALVQHFLPGFSQPGLLFDLLLHLGTLVAVVVFLRERLARTFRGIFSKDPEERRLAFRLVGLLLLAVALTGLVTLPLKKLAVEGMSDFRRIGFALLGTSILLFFAQRVGQERGNGGRELDEVRTRDASAIGLLQAASAVFHGLSRSGNTISVGLFCGLSRRAAAEFSFLLSIPTILAAAGVESLSALRHDPSAFSMGDHLIVYVVGISVSAIVGYFAVAVIQKVIIAMKLSIFSIYCGLLGLLLVAFPPA